VLLFSMMRITRAPADSGPRGSPCTYGCSPFVNSYTDAAYATRKCSRIPGTYLPAWPNASTGENYAEGAPSSVGVCAYFRSQLLASFFPPSAGPSLHFLRSVCVQCDGRWRSSGRFCPASSLFLWLDSENIPVSQSEAALPLRRCSTSSVPRLTPRATLGGQPRAWSVRLLDTWLPCQRPTLRRWLPLISSNSSGCEGGGNMPRILFGPMDSLKLDDISHLQLSREARCRGT